MSFGHVLDSTIQSSLTVPIRLGTKVLCVGSSRRAMARFVGVSHSTLAAREEGQVAAPSLVNPQAARKWHSTLAFLALRADLRAESQVRLVGEYPAFAGRVRSG